MKTINKILSIAKVVWLLPDTEQVDFREINNQQFENPEDMSSV